MEHEPASAALSARDELGLTPLVYAIIGGQPQALKKLAEAGADPEQKTASGTAPWFFAANLPMRRHYLDIWDK